MGMSCFLVQSRTHFTKVSCFSVHFCSQLSPMCCFVFFVACFVHLCVILWLCAAVCGRQFLSRVDILMQFYGVFWEPFMGRSCFFVDTWTCIIKVSCFSVHFCSHLSPISCFVLIFACFALICVILYLCAAVCGRQFLSRVDISMQFSYVF